MKKYFPFITALFIAFSFGFTAHTLLSKKSNNIKMKKVTGIGGIFFKCKDPGKIKDTNDYGASFEWHRLEDSTKKGTTQWSPFKETTKYFEPSAKDFMINYRVENLEELVEQLTKEGVTIVDKIEASEYGKFVHIVDIEGNKIELWEPPAVE